MAITPLTAAAVPAGIVAVQLARQVRQNQPFRQLLSELGSPSPTPDAAAPTAGDELNQFRELVQQRLATAGISTSIRFEISSDAAGNLHVGGDHPRSDEIQRALSGDAEVVASFNRLSASQDTPTNQQFAEQYIADAATTAASFTVSINGDEIEIV